MLLLVCARVKQKLRYDEQQSARNDNPNLYKIYRRPNYCFFRVDIFTKSAIPEISLGKAHEFMGVISLRDPGQSPPLRKVPHRRSGEWGGIVKVRQGVEILFEIGATLG